VVLGGGVVGVEMAQAWASLGSQVTVIEAMERLVPREEPFVGEQLREALEQFGVQVRTGVRASAVSRDSEQIRVRLEESETILGDRLLVAIGRKPLTDGLGLETVGLPTSGYIDVDGHLCVIGASGLYAIGDVNGRSLLTHSGKYQARIAADNILGEPAVALTDGPGAPRVVFTDPQIAAVGLTLAAALHAGIEAEPIDLPTGGTAGASFYGRGAKGTTRFVVDVEREVLIGATFVGPEVSDFLQAATIAIVGQLPLSTLAHAIAPFPTRSELWLKFLEAYETERGTTLHGQPLPAGVDA
jgi:dihydrolipoamide dehydrogenase